VKFRFSTFYFAENRIHPSFDGLVCNPGDNTAKGTTQQKEHIKNFKIEIEIFNISKLSYRLTSGQCCGYGFQQNETNADAKLSGF
jgi:hypothetical protein